MIVNESNKKGVLWDHMAKQSNLLFLMHAHLNSSAWSIIYILTYRSFLVICQVGAETALVINCYAEIDFMNMLKWDRG